MTTATIRKGIKRDLVIEVNGKLTTDMSVLMSMAWEYVRRDGGDLAWAMERVHKISRDIKGYYKNLAESKEYFKELIKMVHPDRNPERVDEATSLTMKLNMFKDEIIPDAVLEECLAF